MRLQVVDVELRTRGLGRWGGVVWCVVDVTPVSMSTQGGKKGVFEKVRMVYW